MIRVLERLTATQFGIDFDPAQVVHLHLHPVIHHALSSLSHAWSGLLHVYVPADSSLLSWVGLVEGWIGLHRVHLPRDEIGHTMCTMEAQLNIRRHLTLLSAFISEDFSLFSVAAFGVWTHLRPATVSFLARQHA